MRRKYFPEKTKDQKHKKKPQKARRKQRKTGKATQVNTECEQKAALMNQGDVLLEPETANLVQFHHYENGRSAEQPQGSLGSWRNFVGN